MNTENRKPIYFVKLKAFSKSEPVTEEHKRPVEPGWDAKQYTWQDAAKWISEGYGVGLALHHTQHLYVIDIDYNNQQVTEIVQDFARARTTVFKTPRGWHIILSKNSLTPKTSGKYTVIFNSKHFEAEVYVGDHTRQLVLPIQGTPRARLNTGMYIYDDMKDEFVVRPIALDSLVSLLSREFFLDMEFQTKTEDTVEASVGSWAQIYGPEWHTLKQKEVLDLMVKRAKEFGRHNTVFYTARLFGYKNWQKVRLFNSAKTLFTADDPEYANGYKELIRVIDEGYESGVKYQSKVDKPRGSSRKDRLSSNEIADYLIHQEAKWCEYKNQRYILVDGLAINRDAFKSYIELTLGIKASVEFIRSFFDGLPKYLELAGSFGIIEDEVTVYDNKAYVALNVREQKENDESEKLYPYVLSTWVENDTFHYVLYDILAKDLPGDDIYLLFNQSPKRIVTRKVLDEKLDAYKGLTKENFRSNICAFDTVLSLASMLSPNPYEDNMALAKVAAMLAGVLGGTSFIAVTGPAGTGKTSLSLLLQTLVTGGYSRLALKDEKDVQAALSARRVVGIDENSRLEYKIQNAIKSSISGVPVIQRKYYTESDATVAKAHSSIIWSTTDIEELESDLGRRALDVRLTPFKRQVMPESTFLEFITKSSGVFGIDACFLQAICIHKFQENVGYLHKVMHEYKNQLPEWFVNETKADVAISYHKLCQWFGVDEATERRAWYATRYSALFKSIAPWDRVLEHAAQNKEFAKKLYDGLYANEIFDEVFQDSDPKAVQENTKEKESLRRKLSRRLNSVSGALRILGFEMAFYKEFHKGKERYKVHIWKHTLPKPKAVEQHQIDGGDDFVSTFEKLFTSNGAFDVVPAANDQPQKEVKLVTIERQIPTTPTTMTEEKPIVHKSDVRPPEHIEMLKSDLHFPVLEEKQEQQAQPVELPLFEDENVSLDSSKNERKEDWSHLTRNSIDLPMFKPQEGSITDYKPTPDNWDMPF